MERTNGEVDADKPKGREASRRRIEAKDIPLTVIEATPPALGRGQKKLLLKAGHHRPVGRKAEVTVTWANDSDRPSKKTLTLIPNAYKVNAQNGDLHNDNNLLDNETKIIAMDLDEGDDTGVYTAGIKSNDKGTYYVSVLIKLKADNGDAGVDEIFVRFEKE